MHLEEFPKDTVVYTRDKQETGKTTGSFRRCQMEGCLGIRIGVRWPNKKITWPCSKGIEIKDEKIYIH